MVAYIFWNPADGNNVMQWQKKMCSQSMFLFNLEWSVPMLAPYEIIKIIVKTKTNFSMTASLNY